MTAVRAARDDIEILLAPEKLRETVENDRVIIGNDETRPHG